MIFLRNLAPSKACIPHTNIVSGDRYPNTQSGGTISSKSHNACTTVAILQAIPHSVPTGGGSAIIVIRSAG